MKKRTLFILGLLTVTMTATGILGQRLLQANIFADVDNDNTYLDAITYVKEQGIVAGYSDNTYRTENPINRAEFTKIIVEAVYPGQAAGSHCFPDVTDDWFAKYVCTAKARGLIAGYDDGTFRPGNDISFVEAAKIIGNAFVLVMPVQEDRAPWYKPFVEGLASRAAIPISIRDFGQPINRGEMAEMIYRLKTGVSKNSLSYEGIEMIQDVLKMDGPKFMKDKQIQGIINAHSEYTENREDIPHENDQQDQQQNQQDQQLTQNENHETSSVSRAIYNRHLPCESKPDLAFTHAVVDPSLVTIVQPAGIIASNSVSHQSAFELKPASGEVPIYAPADAEVIGGAYFAWDGITQYTIQMMIGCEYEVDISSLATVSDKIKAAFPSTPNSSSATQDFKTSVPVKAGEVLGTALASRPGNANPLMTMTLKNYTRKLSYANEARRAVWDSSLFSDCPFDYFDETTRKAYTALFTGRTGFKIVAETCADLSRDITGTISGTWFATQALSEGDFPVLTAGLAQENDAVVIAIFDKETQHGREVYFDKTLSTYKAPADIKDQHCYYSPRGDGIFFFKIISDTEMQLMTDIQATSCPAQFDASKAVTYYR